MASREVISIDWLELMAENTSHVERTIIRSLRPNGVDAVSSYVSRVINRLADRVGWDAGHPGAAQALSDLKVDIVFAPTYWLGYDSSP